MVPQGAAVVIAALTAVRAAEPAGMYLPPSETGGSEFQFNPASPELRQALKKLRKPEPGALMTRFRVTRR